jgi:hypothetical protein
LRVAGLFLKNFSGVPSKKEKKTNEEKNANRTRFLKFERFVRFEDVGRQDTGSIRTGISSPGENK